MAKPTKEQKRKAKLKAQKQQAIHNQQSLTERLSAALEKLCNPILPEYIDDANGPDLTGRHIVWQMGMIAWNIHVTGRHFSPNCQQSPSASLKSPFVQKTSQLCVTR